MGLKNWSRNNRATLRKWRTWWTRMGWFCTRKAKLSMEPWPLRTTQLRTLLGFSTRTRIAYTKRTRTLCPESRRPPQWRKVSRSSRTWCSRQKCSTATRMMASGTWGSSSLASSLAGSPPTRVILSHRSPTRIIRIWIHKRTCWTEALDPILILSISKERAALLTRSLVIRYLCSYLELYRVTTFTQ